MIWPERIRRLIALRAAGRCEYCLLLQADAGFPHEIDHVISRKHGGTSEPENLALACYLCNRYKGSDIASLHPATSHFGASFSSAAGTVARTLPYQRTDHCAAYGYRYGHSRVAADEFGRTVLERRLLQSLGRYPKAV